MLCGCASIEVDGFWKGVKVLKKPCGALGLPGWPSRRVSLPPSTPLVFNALATQLPVYSSPFPSIIRYRRNGGNKKMKNAA